MPSLCSKYTNIDFSAVFASKSVHSTSLRCMFPKRWKMFYNLFIYCSSVRPLFIHILFINRSISKSATNYAQLSLIAPVTFRRQTPPSISSADRPPPFQPFRGLTRERFCSILTFIKFRPELRLRIKRKDHQWITQRKAFVCTENGREK